MRRNGTQWTQLEAFRDFLKFIFLDKVSFAIYVLIYLPKYSSQNLNYFFFYFHWIVILLHYFLYFHKLNEGFGWNGFLCWEILKKYLWLFDYFFQFTCGTDFLQLIIRILNHRFSPNFIPRCNFFFFLIDHWNFQIDILMRFLNFLRINKIVIVLRFPF